VLCSSGMSHDEHTEHEVEERRHQASLYRALSESERLTAAMAFCRQVLAWTPAVDLRGTLIDRERDEAKERVERAMARRR